jgi:hypothetical protein
MGSSRRSRRRVVRVFILEHVHELESGDEDVKLIGVNSSEEAGKCAISDRVRRPGFSDHAEGFHLTPYDLDKTHWTEGFVTIKGEG